MAFINPVWFRVELPQVSVMRFIAETAPEHYLMGTTGGSVYHAVVLSEDVVEYLINEYQIEELVILSPTEVKKVLRSCNRKWGNWELLDL
jgi:hypothetical protein